MKLSIISEMPLHSYHLDDNGESSAYTRRTSPVKSPNYEKALIKFMRRFPGPDWIVIVSPTLRKRDIKEYLLSRGVSSRSLDKSIIFVHDGFTVQKETVTPWILVHNFAHAIGLDGKSHVVFPLLGYEELAPHSNELDDPNGRFQEQSNLSPEEVWYPGVERFDSLSSSSMPDPSDIVDKVQSDFKFKSANAGSVESIDELTCEMFVDYMKHGKIRSKSDIDYSKVEQYFYKSLQSYVGKVVIFSVNDG